MRDLFFYALCAAMLSMAAVTVLARNLFRASLGLLGVLLGTAALFLLLRAEMPALVQIMVYIGGILIFVLYAVLLTSELGGRMPGPSPAKIGIAVIAAVAAFAWLGRLAWSTASPRAGAGYPAVSLAAEGPGSAASSATQGSAGTVGPAGSPIAALKPLGARLLDPGPGGFLVSFELISALLLAALVGAIAIARGGRAPRAVPEAGRAAARAGGSP